MPDGNGGSTIEYYWDGEKTTEEEYNAGIAQYIDLNKTAAVSLKNTKLDKFSIEWYSTDPAVASVSLDGKIKALSPGTATIYTETGGVRNECVVTVR